MNNELDTFYMNIDTQNRVRVVWNVCLTMPASIYGYVDVEATTAEEATQLALDKHVADVKWDYETCGYDDDAVTVLDVECDNPPVDAIPVRPGRKTRANLDALFETETQTTKAEEQGQHAEEGGRSCK
jgi:hypothetical protein